ncbi:MAG: hypothetical protein LBU00_03115 [Treponema sp.]|jgi:hypothetical protein|nr:hypothetical protein [Treponema sp.]
MKFFYIRRVATGFLCAVVLFLAGCSQPGGVLPEKEPEQEQSPGTEKPRILTGLEIAALPDITVYAAGANFAFDPTGLVVHGLYSDGTLEVLPPSAYVIDDTKITGTGQQRVFIRKEGLESVAILIYLDPTGRVLQSAALTAPPPATQTLGKAFSTTGMVITGTYANGDTATLDAGLCKITGYDKRLRGKQRVTFKINGKPLATDMEITVKLPAGSAITIMGRSTSVYRPGPGGTESYRPVWIKGMPFSLEDSGMRVEARAGGQTYVLTWGKGLGPGDTVTGYTSTTTGKQTLTLNLDSFTAAFDVFVLDAEPALWFDYGYMRHAGDTTGAGPGVGRYYARPGETLVLAPVRYLIGWNADFTDATGTTYTWSVTGGASGTASTSGEFYSFTPTATGTYTVKVNVTGRNFVTNTPITLSASTEVECYSETLPAPSGRPAYVSPLKNFAPGQFTERGTGHGWSLGAALGYEVWSVPSGTTTVRIVGNGFGLWSEPGIVWVQEDANGNGIPDEMWYEVPGSDDTHSHWKEAIARRYGVKYFRVAEGSSTPNEYGQTIHTIGWVDSRGRAGILPGGWPHEWGVSGDWVTYTGTLLRSDIVKKSDDSSDFTLGAGGFWGYVDAYNGDKQYVDCAAANAKKADGTSAGLTTIRFVKVQTGIFRYESAFGEMSTEIVSATGLSDQSGGFPNPIQ